MVYRKISLFKFITTLLAAAAASQIGGEFVSRDSALAQSFGENPDSFSVPSSLPEGIILKIDGSPSMQFANELMESQFEGRFPNVDVQLEASRTDEALEALINGDIDLVSAGHPLTAAEKAQGLKELLIAREKLAILIGSENPFDGDLTFEQFAQIFRGEITNWYYVGGPDWPIRVVDRPEYSDTRRAIGIYDVFHDQPFETGYTADPVPVDDTDAVIEALGDDGIGYAVVSQVIGRDDVTLIPMHETLPYNPRYPYSQHRAFVYREEASDAVLAFLGLAYELLGPQEATEVAETSEPPAVTDVETARGNEFPMWLVWLLGVPVLGVLVLSWFLLNAQEAETSEAAAASGTARVAASRARRSSMDAPTAEPEPAETPNTAPVASPTVEPEPAGTPNAAPVASSTVESEPSETPNAAPVASPTVEPEPAVAPRASSEVQSTETPMAEPAALGAPTATHKTSPQIVLTPRNHQNVYAYWEIPSDRLDTLKGEGGETFMVRLYDVTDLAADAALPVHTAQLECEAENSDLLIPIQLDDRDYRVEVGYLTEDKRWLPIAKSDPVRVPARPKDEPRQSQLPEGVAATAAADAGLLKQPAAESAERVDQNRIVLTPRNPKKAYAYWEVSEASKAALKAEGGKDCQLRIYDVTNIDLSQQPPHSTLIYDVSDTDRDRFVPLPNTKCVYVAELGYCTEEGVWLDLARSQPIRADAILSPAPEATSDLGSSTEGSAAVGDLAATTVADTPTEEPVEASPVTPVQKKTDAEPSPDSASAEPIEAAQNPVEEASAEPAKAASSPTLVEAESAKPASSPTLVKEESTELASSPTLIEAESAEASSSAPVADAPVESVAASFPTLANEKSAEPAETTSFALAEDEAAKPDEASTSTPTEYQANKTIEERSSAPSDYEQAYEPFEPTDESSITLSPRTADEVYATWHVPALIKKGAKNLGGQQYQLRLYDVTAIDLDTQPAHRVEVYPCHETDQNRIIPVPQPNRDYLVEIGYETTDNRWIQLARSTHIHMANGAAAGAIAGERATDAAAPALETRSCAIETVKVQRRRHALQLNAEQIRHIQDTVAISYHLDPGLHILCIRDGVFNYGGAAAHQGEPFVMLWIEGGAVINKKTGLLVNTTWSTLNGYADTLTLDVKAPAKLNAFFLDTFPDDNIGELTLTAIKL